MYYHDKYSSLNACLGENLWKGDKLYRSGTTFQLFQNILEYSQTFSNILKYFWIFLNTLEYLVTFWNTLE